MITFKGWWVGQRKSEHCLDVKNIFGRSLSQLLYNQIKTSWPAMIFHMRANPTALFAF